MSNHITQFPIFKKIELADRDFIQERLWEYQPEASELTFTNLFIWRAHYGTTWCMYQDWLLIVYHKPGGAYGLMPVGPPPRQEVTRLLLGWLREQGIPKPRLERVDQRLVNELARADDFIIEPTREHFDYVYLSRDFIELGGRKYHAKRNFLNTFRNTYHFIYQAITENDIADCIMMADEWCRIRRCKEDMDLIGESGAIYEALRNLSALKIEGAMIQVDGKIEAFTLGERLNSQTAVIHIEKANPDIKGLYAAINQQFCEHNWQNVLYVNREQDLGKPTLREAKLSYRPHHMVEKFRIRLKETA